MNLQMICSFLKQCFYLGINHGYYIYKVINYIIRFRQYTWATKTRLYFNFLFHIFCNKYAPIHGNVCRYPYIVYYIGEENREDELLCIVNKWEVERNSSS